MSASRIELSNLRLWLTVLLTMISLLLLTQAIAALPEYPHVVATINGQTITGERFESEMLLKQLKLGLANRPSQPVSEAELLNRIMADTLILQAADSTGPFVDPALVEGEIRLILGGFQLTDGEMKQHLARSDLSWRDFERSVSDYVRMSQFLTEGLLAGISQGKQAYLESWLAEGFQEAELAFDQDFLARINASAMD